jgi:NADH dehydrogenase/NADH:ubiquinone oxidoreductase subunit G
MILTINGRPLAAAPGETLLQVARRAGVDLPTLCHHEGLEAWGGCRLCVVEVRRRPDEAPKVVPSCLQLAEDGVRVETHTENLLRIRATLLDLLLTRAPGSELIRRLAVEHGVTDGTFVPQPEPTNCILCTLCTRACAAVGAHAISTAGRGAEGEVSLPFVDDADACVGCGSCAAVCPTGCIELRDEGTRRTIWGRTFERVPCEVTGQPTLTREYAALLSKRSGLPADSFFVSDEGRRRQVADKVAGLVGVGEGRAA